MANVQAVAQYGPVAPANGPAAPPVAAPGTVPGVPCCHPHAHDQRPGVDGQRVVG